MAAFAAFPLGILHPASLAALAGLNQACFPKLVVEVTGKNKKMVSTDVEQREQIPQILNVFLHYSSTAGTIHDPADSEQCLQRALPTLQNDSIARQQTWSCTRYPLPHGMTSALLDPQVQEKQGLANQSWI